MGEDNHGSSKIDWMYEGKNSSIDHEQYLLGKRITSVANEEDDKGDFSVKAESSVATGNVTVLERLDYESKVREDPLFQIRKNDYEHRKELLSNPLKKKRIQNMLKQALEKDLQKSGANRDGSNSSSESRESSSSEDERRYKKHRKYKHHRPTSDFHSDSSKYRKSYSERHAKTHDKKKSHKHDKSKERSDEASSEDERSRRHKPEGFGLMYLQDGKHTSTAVKKRRQRSPSPEKPKEKYQRANKSGFSRRLTKEELEKKRIEMMNNATWRDSQRKGNVKKFRIEEEREDAKERKQKMEREKDKYGNSRDFLHNMKLKTASSGSVEDSVRRKRHTLSHKF